MTIEVPAPLLVSYVLLWLLVAGQGVALLGLVRVVYRLQQQGALTKPGTAGEQLQAGQPVPEFVATDLAGRPVRSVDLAGSPGALLFISPNCEACALTLAEMDALSHKVDGRILVICRGDRDECRALAAEHEIGVPIVADERHEISDLFRISSTPTAVLVTADHTIQSYGQPQRDPERPAEMAPAVADASAQ